MNEASQQPAGVITPDAVYTRAEFLARSGLCEQVLRDLEREGRLKVVAVGRRKFIRGKDWVAYIDRIAEGK